MLTPETLSELEARLERVQEGDRPLPWVVHTGCSYRRIASAPTGENGYMSFPDGNVLHGTKCWHDGHPDLSMDEWHLEALVHIVNFVFAHLDDIIALARAGRLT